MGSTITKLSSLEYNCSDMSLSCLDKLHINVHMHDATVHCSDMYNVWIDKSDINIHEAKVHYG